MLTRWLAIAAGIALLFLAPARAADFTMFNGKTITYIVSTAPGGGYDLYGRMIARHLPKYLKGARVIVRNVPGAGSIIGANAIYTARPDGLTIGMFNTGLIYDQIRGRSGLKFDLAKFSWIGKAAYETRVVLVSTRSGMKSFNDIINARSPVKFSTSGIGTASFFDTRILTDALNLNIQTINNFTGNSGEMSMLRGEVVGQVGQVDTLDQFVKNGHGFYALALTGPREAHPEIPHVTDYLKDERGRRLIALLNAVSELGRLTAGPPGIPSDVLAVLREGLVMVMEDPEFRAEAERLNLKVDHLPGDVVDARIKAVLNQPPETVAALKRAAGNE